MFIIKNLILILILSSCSSLVSHKDLFKKSKLSKIEKLTSKEVSETSYTPKIAEKTEQQVVVKEEVLETSVDQEIRNEVSSINKETELENEAFLLDYKKKHYNFWIKYYSKRENKRFTRHVNNGQLYKNIIEQVLDFHELPRDLFFVGLIESGYNTYIKSRASATGPWQFMKGTAKEYGLKVDRYVDERSNIVKSTHAAASYFKDLYNIFGSWELALCAYNAGHNRIIRAIRKGNTRDYKELVRKRLIPKETIYYVPKVMAAKEIYNNPKKYGFNFKAERESAFDHVKAVTVKGSFDTHKLASKYGVPHGLFKKLNPEIRSRWVRSRKMKLFVPTKEVTHFAGIFKKEERIDYSRSSRSVKSTYRVRRGDNLSTIARRLGVSLSSLKRINGIRGSKIYVGQKLIVRKPSHSSGGSYAIHKVRRGENLSRIARKYKMRLSHLKRINSLRSSRIMIGQSLRVASPGKVVRYRVRRGDNLIKLAQKFDTNVRDLKALNGIIGSKLYVGQELKIPSQG